MKLFVSILCVFFPLLLMANNHKGDWIQKSNLPSLGRHGATAFSIGNKGYVGLGHINSGAIIDFQDIWEYDFGSDSWTQKVDFPEPQAEYALSFGANGKGYIAYNTVFYEFCPVQNSFTQLADVPFSAQVSPTCSIQDSVAVIYGSSIYKYEPISGTWSAPVNFADFYPITAYSLSDKIYSLGFNLDFTVSLKRYDDNVGWTEISNYPDTINTSHLISFELNGKGYFFMGGPATDANGSICWEYDHDSSTWKKMKTFQGAARRYFTAFKINNRAYITTGTSGVNYNDLWEFVPPDTTKLIPGPIIDVVYNPNTLPYPNPTNAEVFFELQNNPDSVVYDLKIYDLTGKFVLQEFSSGNLIEIDMSSLAAGEYFYHLIKGSESWKKGKLIKI